MADPRRPVFDQTTVPPGRYVFRGVRFEDSRLHLDSNQFEHCEFVRCALIFSATDSVRVAFSDLRSSRIMFAGPARGVVERLAALYRDARDGAERVEALFAAIRRGDDPRAAARLASWEHLRSDAAAHTFTFLRNLHQAGGRWRDDVEGVFADVRAGDLRALAPADIDADLQEMARAAGGDPGFGWERLRLRVTHPEWADPDAVSTGIARLVRALSAYDVATGGSGLVIEDAHGTGSPAVAAALPA